MTGEIAEVRDAELAERIVALLSAYDEGVCTAPVARTPIRHYECFAEPKPGSTGSLILRVDSSVAARPIARTSSREFGERIAALLERADPPTLVPPRKTGIGWF